MELRGSTFQLKVSNQKGASSFEDALFKILDLHVKELIKNWDGAQIFTILPKNEYPKLLPTHPQTDIKSPLLHV